jgi:para-nitrobenzyl esterase
MAFRNMLRALVAATIFSASAQAAMIPIASDPVVTDGGKVAGTQLASGVRAYLGIPFARPPVGPLRWVAPQPMHWEGVWNADRKGAECIQVLRPHNINHYFGEEATSEDCLYLNLWTPASAMPASKLPVIVFIYGGGYTIGSSGMSNYGGEDVAKAGAIFVNFNYRVGAMGYMAHPELSAEQGGHSGNYGTMDQTAALKWVRANIARFGGDPEQVLIMGQSAGAGSVVSQIFSPMARGLFRAAVMSSGCNFSSGGLMGDGPTLAEAERTGLEVQKRVGAANLAALRDVPADRILAIQSESQVGVKVEGVRIGGPIIDGYVLPEGKAALLARGAIARVPIIASYNSDDVDQGMNPIARARTMADWQRIAGELYGKDAPAFLALFPVKSDAEVPALARQVASMAGFEQAARQCAVAQAAQGQKAWLDLFARKHPYTPGVSIADQDPTTIGAYHTGDIPYWFGTLDTYNSRRPTREWTAYDRDLSAKMLGGLIAMARTGSPETAAMAWPAWSARLERKLVLGDSVTVRPLDGRRLQWLSDHPIAAVRPGSAGPRD